jgi:hypothetical protein
MSALKGQYSTTQKSWAPHNLVVRYMATLTLIKTLKINAVGGRVYKSCWAFGGVYDLIGCIYIAYATYTYT